MLFLTIEFANKAENKYFVGTRYDEARALGLNFMGYDAVVCNGNIARNVHLGFRTNLAPLAGAKFI